MHGGGACQIYAGVAELIEGIRASAHGEKFQIAVHCLLTAGPHCFGEGNSRSVARGVFIDIEGSVEMRDPRPFVLYFIVHGEDRAEIVAHQSCVQVIQGVGIEGFAPLRHLMG